MHTCGAGLAFQQYRLTRFEAAQRMYARSIRVRTRCPKPASIVCVCACLHASISRVV